MTYLPVKKESMETLHQKQLDLTVFMTPCLKRMPSKYMQYCINSLSLHFESLLSLKTEHPTENISLLSVIYFLY